MNVYGEEEEGGSVGMDGAKQSSVIYVSADMDDGSKSVVSPWNIVYG